MNRADLEEMWSLVDRLEELARRNGYPADLTHLAREARATYACYREEVPA